MPASTIHSANANRGSYTIQISESQRAALETLLNTREGLAMQGVGNPLEYWSEMVRALPNDEAESPGILHGFCL